MEYVTDSDGQRRPIDPILALRGVGRELWADEEADAYVSRLREGWPEPRIPGHRRVRVPD